MKGLVKGVVWECPVVTEGEGRARAEWEGEQGAQKHVLSREVMCNEPPLLKCSEKTRPIRREEEERRYLG